MWRKIIRKRWNEIKLAGKKKKEKEEKKSWKSFLNWGESRGERCVRQNQNKSRVTRKLIKFVNPKRKVLLVCLFVCLFVASLILVRKKPDFSCSGWKH